MPEGNLLLGALAGVLGTVVITLLLLPLRTAGHTLDIPYLLGSRFIDPANKTKLYLAGYVLHLIAGAAWGAMYILTLTAMGITPNWPAGILWGFAHGIFIGVMMSTVAEQHPQIGEGKPISDPGILGSNWSSLMPYIVLGAHVVFGVITLLTYQLLFNP